jgi:hypothetical protein
MCFKIPTPSLITNLQVGSCNASNVIAASIQQILYLQMLLFYALQVIMLLLIIVLTDYVI